jgi:chromosome segregation ATPase
MSCEQLEHHLRDTQEEKRRLTEQLNTSERKMQGLDEEITQNRAHIDLYKIQLEELTNERNLLKVTLTLHLYFLIY